MSRAGPNTPPALCIHTSSSHQARTLAPCPGMSPWDLHKLLQPHLSRGQLLLWIQHRHNLVLMFLETQKASRTWAGKKKNHPSVVPGPQGATMVVSLCPFARATLSSPCQRSGACTPALRSEGTAIGRPLEGGRAAGPGPGVQTGGLAPCSAFTSSNN